MDLKVTRNPALRPWQYFVDATGINIGTDLEVLHIRSDRGAVMGAVIGFPLRPSESTAGPDILAPAHLETDELAEWVQQTIVGRYLIILPGRIYLDASGSFPCVYDPVARIAGLDPDAIMTPDAFAQRQTRRITSGSDWFPAGLTGHEGVLRLMPNHVLDLRDYTTSRVRFVAGLPARMGVQEVAAEVIGAVRMQIEALLAANKRPALALTAGRDSRMIMVAARPYLKEVSFFTISDKRRAIDTDTQCAREMAGALGLDWFELPRQLATPEEQSTYLGQTGYVVAGMSSQIWPSLRPLHGKYSFVGGTGGEIGRGFYFKGFDRWSHLNTYRLVSRMGLPHDERTMQAVQRWLDGLSPEDSYHLLDLAYLELREGCMNGAQLPGDQTIPRYLPLLSRRSVDAMLALSARDKRANSLPATAIRMYWPEAALFRFNSLGTMRNTLAQTRRVLKDPQVLTVKIRKMLS